MRVLEKKKNVWNSWALEAHNFDMPGTGTHVLTWPEKLVITLILKPRSIRYTSIKSLNSQLFGTKFSNTLISHSIDSMKDLNYQGTFLNLPNSLTKNTQEQLDITYGNANGDVNGVAQKSLTIIRHVNGLHDCVDLLTSDIAKSFPSMNYFCHFNSQFIDDKLYHEFFSTFLTIIPAVKANKQLNENLLADIAEREIAAAAVNDIGASDSLIGSAASETSEILEAIPIKNNAINVDDSNSVVTTSSFSVANNNFKNQINLHSIIYHINCTISKMCYAHKHINSHKQVYSDFYKYF
jgi:hypothetical protein